MCMQNENCRKVDSVNNREDKPQLLKGESPGFQYICHLNIEVPLSQLSWKRTGNISGRGLDDIQCQWFTESCQKCLSCAALFESSKN